MVPYLVDVVVTISSVCVDTFCCCCLLLLLLLLFLVDVVAAKRSVPIFGALKLLVDINCFARISW